MTRCTSMQTDIRCYTGSVIHTIIEILGKLYSIRDVTSFCCSFLRKLSKCSVALSDLPVQPNESSLGELPVLPAIWPLHGVASSLFTPAHGDQSASTLHLVSTVCAPYQCAIKLHPSNSLNICQNPSTGYVGTMYFVGTSCVLLGFVV